MSNETSDDIESSLLSPELQEAIIMIMNLRWGFIRKVYSILALQILATIAVTAAVAANSPFVVFFQTTRAGWFVYSAILVAAITGCLYKLQFWCFSLCSPPFTKTTIPSSSFSLLLALAASFISTPIILEAETVAVVLVVTLILYTFWLARKGLKFGFVPPFLLSLVVTLIIFIVYMIYWPVAKISYMLYGGLFVVTWFIYIIYETGELILRTEVNELIQVQGMTYDQYIWASVLFYLDVLKFLRNIILSIIVSIFLGLAIIFKAIFCR